MKKGTHQHCLTLELKDDDGLVEEYDKWHQPGNVWPEILESIRASGIQDMRIYRKGVLLIMVLDVDSSFSFERKTELDKNNYKVQEWEHLMEKFQKVDLIDSSQSKWQLMKQVFQFLEDR